MLTTTQIEEIDRDLQKGIALEDIAKRFGMTYGQLRYQLGECGRKVVRFRRLIDAAPLPDEKKAA